MGVCEDGSSAMGCGDQTEFRNCADVAIEPLVTSGYIVGPASRSVIAAAADSENGEANEVDQQLPGDYVTIVPRPLTETTQGILFFYSCNMHF